MWLRKSSYSGNLTCSTSLLLVLVFDFKVPVASPCVFNNLACMNGECRMLELLFIEFKILWIPLLVYIWHIWCSLSEVLVWAIEALILKNVICKTVRVLLETNCWESGPLTCWQLSCFSMSATCDNRQCDTWIFLWPDLGPPVTLENQPGKSKKNLFP